MVKQALKSQHSREIILQSGLKLFSTKGYHGTSIKDIAAEAGISIGRLYHHFSNKMQIFTSLLEQYWQKLLDPKLPMNQLITQARFPDDFGKLARAIRDVVKNHDAYIKLIYVDVVEFRGEHINRFYGNMARSFRELYRDRFESLNDTGKLNPKADPYLAVMLMFRFFFHYFLVETSFGVQNHFGLSETDLLEGAEELILHGMMAQSRVEAQ